MGGGWTKGVIMTLTGHFYSDFQNSDHLKSAVLCHRLSVCGLSHGRTLDAQFL